MIRLASILLGATATVFVSSAAFSADLAPQPVEPVAPAALYDWTGFYVGAHAGYGWAREHDNQSTLFPASLPTPTPPPVADHFSLDGFVGGVHGGYNYQINQFVIGAEGDLDYADLKKNLPYSYTGGASTGSYRFRTDFQGSARLRAGYAIDNLLLYATGGVAFANAKLTTDGGSNSNTHVGWTAGAGVEYAFTQNWIGRAELRYTDFEKKSYQTLHGPVKAGWNQTTAELGVSYKF